MQDVQELEDAAWSSAYGIATPQQTALLDADPAAWRVTLERLVGRTDDLLTRRGSELGNGADGEAMAQLTDIRDRLRAAIDGIDMTPRPRPVSEEGAPGRPVAADTAAPAGDAAAADDGEADDREADDREADDVGAADDGETAEPGEVELQVTWSSDRLVIWAGGPGREPADHDELSDRLEAVGAPPHGWSPHRAVPLPSGAKAAALSIEMADALGWLVTVGAGPRDDGDGDGIGASVRWLGRASLTAVDLVAQGRVVPTLVAARRSGGRAADVSVSWVPALVDGEEVSRLTSTMPSTVTALDRADARAVALAVIERVVEAVLRQAANRVDLPAAPPHVRTTSDVSAAVLARLDGSPFPAPIAAATSLARRVSAWGKPVAGVARTKLVVQLDEPDDSNAWFLSVLGPGAEGKMLPVELALADRKDTAAVAAELDRLERMLPELLRAGGRRRGEVYLSQNEAWDFMTERGPTLQTAGFEVRVPQLSRRRPTPALRLLTSPAGDSVVGAAQLSNVQWSVLFDDVELTASEVTRLAAEAKPLVQSRGKWVELDRADLVEAAAALAERETKTTLTGAEILRQAVGLERSPLAGGVQVDGSSWATEILEKAKHLALEPVTTPPGFQGELRSYQAEALAWLGFLDAVGLGGCLALDMGLGKTPTVLAQVAATGADAPTLVIAPPAVVGNWAAEAQRFTPGLQVVVHHGASRASAKELEKEISGADLVITTYATAVRDVDGLSAIQWDRVVVDEAQAIKNPASETAQQLRRIEARNKVALTGTPIENGLGDLWSILDFANPGIVGSRPAFIAQLSGDGEAALRALNGVLVFRRTKAEPFVAQELPDHIDELDHCTMTPEQIGLYQAVLDELVANAGTSSGQAKKGAVLAAITKLKQICNHPAAYLPDDEPLAGRSGKLARLEEIVQAVFAAGEKILVFTHFAEWGKRMADHLTEVTSDDIDCYHGGLARGARDRMVEHFQSLDGPGALVLSLKAGGTGLNLTAASHVVLYDRWWNPAVEDQARDRAWRIGQERTVVSHRLVCPGTVDERVEEVVAGKRHIADLVLPKSSSLADLDAAQLRTALGLRPESLLTEEAL
ncbi:MAG: DEAD/DEAH box helicase [Acidimicrobiia bacterium]|nr:DEAD/DEAH box helicase [Acidimicrobiia bacterium]